MTASSILITGADGYLGQRTAEALLKTTQADLILWLRARTPDELEKKKARIFRLLNSSEGRKRIRLSYGDLREPEPFSLLRSEMSTISHILHTAAVIRFNVEADLAQTVNVEGSHKILDFASQLSGLKRLGYLSSLYSAGLQEGDLKEEPWSSKAGFANHYEESKWKAENHLIEKYSALPWQIYRVSTVIADDESGMVSQWNAVHNSLKLLYYGLISLMPGDKSTPLYFVTGRFAAAAMADLLATPSGNKKIYHLSSHFESTIELDTLVQTAFEAFKQSEDFRERRILPPLYADWKSFEMLSKAMVGMGGEMLSQALAAMTPFARQLYSKKRVSTAQLQSDWKNFYTMPMKTIVTEMCRYMVRTKFGRELTEAEQTENFYAY